MRVIMALCDRIQVLDHGKTHRDGLAGRDPPNEAVLAPTSASAGSRAASC